ncbi:hypothetical protein ACFTWF_32235 [Rhodococcus sp. NPDC056960]|uniref:hypothetical protein n=1 Tax=Rhodococcus sp. NPDC056960 TaxID=3345982 RepID=UPI00363C048B
MSSKSVTIALLPSEPSQARAEVSWGGKKLEVETSANISLAHGIEPWVYPAALVGMKRGMPVSTDEPVDSAVLKGVEKAQSLLDSWYGDMGAVEVHAELSTVAECQDGRGVGCFFSGGLDSFYSAIKHSDTITHVIFVHGFDIMLDNEKLFLETVTAMRRAAADLGKQLIEVRTNLRHLHFLNGVDWGRAAHGAVLAHVGLLLSEHLHTVIVPSSFAKSIQEPWGSHPDLDHLWASSAVRFEHDGVEATRPQKAAGIAQSPAALDNLHVCWTNYGTDYNCGKCEKCVRTMINLRVAGALDRCPSLPDEIPLEVIGRTRLDHGAKQFAQENLDALRASDIDDPALEEALEKAMNPSAMKQVELSIHTALRNAQLLATALVAKSSRKVGQLVGRG